jgi:methylated-DNA-protein-cysteine methyltransferase related protein
MNYIEKVHKIVQKIPKGKVTTYGAISKAIGVNPQMVGWALHANKDSIKTPCHRVVNKDGRLAPGYVFGGPDVKRRRLEDEKVPFKDSMHVDLSNCLWLPSSS